MKLIYENDIPTKAEAEYYKLYSNNDLKEIRNEVNSNRWKPNGITDNRKEWREKNRIHSAIMKMLGISKELGFKSVEITEELKP